MADKKYRLSFEMTDGTKQSVEFAVPQGESVTPDYAAAEGEPGHILNRTHYMEMGEILPETTITLIDAEGLLPQTIEFTKGDTYKVKWNGTEYECIADTAESDYGTSSFIGNTALTGGEDNGMPFALATMPGMGTVVFYMEAASGESEVVLSINGPTVHKLDPKYLPDTMYVQWDVSTMTADKTSNEILIAMRNRQSVFLVSNNELHPCVCCEPRGAFFLMFSVTENSGEITAITQVGAACVKPDGSVILG